MDCEIWNIVGALGTWVGSIATFLAVIVALKPYRRKLKVSPIHIQYTFNGKTSSAGYLLSITNLCEKQLGIASWGVATKWKHSLYEVMGLDLMLTPDQGQKISINPQELNDALQKIDKRKFRFFVIDQARHQYFSSPQKKTDFVIDSK